MCVPDLLKCSFPRLVILPVSHRLQEDAVFLAPLPGLVYLASLPLSLIVSFCISGIKKVGIQPSTQLAVAHDVPRVCLLQPFTPLTSSHTAHSFACHVSLLAVTRHNSKEVSVLSLQSVYGVPSLSIYKAHSPGPSDQGIVLPIVGQTFLYPLSSKTISQRHAYLLVLSWSWKSFNEFLLIWLQVTVRLMRMLS